MLARRYRLAALIEERQEELVSECLKFEYVLATFKNIFRSQNKPNLHWWDAKHSFAIRKGGEGYASRILRE